MPLLLSTLLLLAQLLLAVHHADLSAHPHGNHCDVCLVGHGLDHTVVAGDVLPPRHSPDSVPFDRIFITGSSLPVLAYRSRAPPVFPG